MLITKAAYTDPMYDLDPLWHLPELVALRAEWQRLAERARAARQAYATYAGQDQRMVGKLAIQEAAAHAAERFAYKGMWRRWEQLGKMSYHRSYANPYLKYSARIRYLQ